MAVPGGTDDREGFGTPCRNGAGAEPDVAAGGRGRNEGDGPATEPGLPENEPSFDALTRAAALLLAAPAALILLCEDDGFRLKSAWGAIGGAEGATVAAAERACRSLAQGEAPLLVVPDMAADPACRDLAPLHDRSALRRMSGGAGGGIGFLAGVALRLSCGECIGCLCVLDGSARPDAGGAALEALQGLGQTAVALIEARLQAADLQRLHAHAGLSDDLGRIALESLDYAAALDETAQVLGRHLGADIVVLTRLEEGVGLRHTASWAAEPAIHRAIDSFVQGEVLGPGDTPSFAAIRDQVPLLVTDIQARARLPEGRLSRLLHRAGLQQYVVVPLRLGGERCGISIGFRRGGVDLEEVQQRVLRVRSRIAALLERKQASDRMVFLGSILDQCVEGMAVLEADRQDPSLRRFVYVNRAMTGLTGYRTEELVGAATTILQPESPDPAATEATIGRLQAGETVELEVSNRRKDGSRIWLNLQVTPMRDPAGGDRRLMICSARDAGERRRMLLELRELQEQTRKLFDLNPVPMWLYDRANLRFRDVNEAALRDYGYSREEFLSMRLTDLRGAPDPARPVPGLGGAGAAEEAGPEPEIWRHLTKSGEERLVKIVSHDFDDGPEGRVLVAAIDVTREKGYERSLLEAKYQAEQANAIKSEFLAHMSHEMRTPLNAIIGFSEMIKAGLHGPLGAEKYVEYVDAIRESGGELLYFINDVLQLIEMDSSALGLRRSRVELRLLLHDMLQQYSAAFAERNIRLQQVEIPEGLAVLADLRAIRQVLSHVLQNLVKFCDGAAVRIRSEPEPAGHRIRLSIADSGPGIPEDILREIFSPFFTSRSSIRRAGQGAGLGLPICRRLLQAQGGEIRIDSRPGAGTTVTIALPQHPQAVAPASADQGAAS